MPNFYLQPLSNFDIYFELHATTEVTASFPSTLTTYPIEKGQKVTDNIITDPVTVSFTGVLSDVGNFSLLGELTNAATSAAGITNTDNKTMLSLEDYIYELRKMRDDKEIFEVWFSQEKNAIDPLEYAILTTFEMSKSAEQGASWSLTLELEEVRFADPAKVVAEARSDWQDTLAPKEEGAGNTTGVTEAQDTRVEQGADYSRVIDNESGDVISTKLSGGHRDTGTY